MATFRTKTVGLLTSVVSIYDKTKTYITGHISQKTINSVACLGAGLTTFIDPYTDTGNVFLSANVYVSPNGRMFILSTNAAGINTIALYNFDVTTGIKGSLIGRIQLTMPNAAATTHTVRAFAVMDSGTTGWTIALGTIGTVLVNGGVFTVWNVALADFTSSPTVFGMAIASNTKAVYFQQDPSFLGNANNITAISGGDFDLVLNPGYFYIETGVLASMSFYGFDMTATPTIAIQTTTSPTVNTTPTFTLTGHGYALNDQVVLLTNVPTAFVGTTSTIQAVYFINNPTANTFELKATIAGASINNTSATSGTTIARAHGQTTAGFLASKKTGIVTGFSGTITLTNSHNIVTPVTGHPNAGSSCMFVSSSTSFHLFKLSDITAGATSFPSLATINNTGSGQDITAPTTVQARYSQTLGKIIYTIGICTLVVKDWVNSAIISSFGGQQQTWYENSGLATVGLGFTALAGLESRGGWIFLIGNTAGQRVVIAFDLYSSATFGLSYITTPVFPTNLATFKTLGSFRQLSDSTVSMNRQYKTAATSGDAIFNDPTTGWTNVPNDVDESGFAISNFTQLRLLPRLIEKAPYSPAQTSDVLFGYVSTIESSDNWEGSEENSTKSANSPMYVAFRLLTAYASVIPELFLRGYDDSGNLVVSLNTVANAGIVNYTTNNGTSWNALGTIPNTALTTEVRFQITAPPAIAAITWALTES